MKDPNILITTFGYTWQVVPELLGFTNPRLVNLYANHPRWLEIEKARWEALIQPVDEVLCIATQGQGSDSAIAALYDWCDTLDSEDVLCLRIWQAANIGDLASEADCQRMAECIYRLVLHASERVDGGQLTISLTGGRKTMSSDIQNAAVFFGCHALVHVIQNETYAQMLRDLRPEDFIRPLPAELRDAVTPLVAGRYEQNPVVDLNANGPITGDNFPIPFPDDSGTIDIGTDRPDLVAEIRLVHSEGCIASILA